MSLERLFGKSPGDTSMTLKSEPEAHPEPKVPWRGFGDGGGCRPPGVGIVGGAEGDRTPDFCLAKAALSQLSYSPVAFVPYPAPGRLIAIVASLRGT